MRLWRRFRGKAAGETAGRASEAWRLWPLQGLGKEVQAHLQRAVEIVERHVDLQHYPELVSVQATGGEGTILQAAQEVEAALQLAPDHPELTFLHATLLMLALQGASA